MINPAHLHLVTNHIPVLGCLFVGALLAAALATRSADLARASLAAFALVALVTIPAYLSGDPAHEIVEEMDGVSRRAIHTHEDAALPAFVVIETLGALSVFGLVWFRGGRPAPRAFLAAALALAIVASLLVARAANLGGLIRHPEIRIQNASP